MRVAHAAARLLLLLAVLPASAVAADVAAERAEVAVMSKDEYRRFLGSHHALDRLFCEGQSCFFLVSARERSELDASGRRFQISTLAASQNARGTLTDGGANGLFHDVQETKDLLLDLQARYPDLARVTTVGRSVEGRDLLALKISDNVQLEEAEPNVFVMGCHHAREWISVEVPLAFAQYLLEHFTDDANVRAAVSGAQIYIVPIVNPDGLEFSIHTYRYWRKNRRYNGDLSWGVDLNRNYGYMWGLDDIGSSPYSNYEDYRGLSAFSEPEVRLLGDFMLSHPPSASLSYHNFSQVILYPWGYIDAPAPDEIEMRAIAEEMSQRIFEVNGRRYRYGTGPELMYLTNGDSNDWVYATFSAPSLTIELPPDSQSLGGFYTTETEIAPIIAENIPALLYLVNYAADRPARQQSNARR